jgi:hypothetical protein
MEEQEKTDDLLFKNQRRAKPPAFQERGVFHPISCHERQTLQ